MIKKGLGAHLVITSRIHAHDHSFGSLPAAVENLEAQRTLRTTAWALVVRVQTFVNSMHC